MDDLVLADVDPAKLVVCSVLLQPAGIRARFVGQ
jgi:hypothetical protein